MKYVKRIMLCKNNETQLDVFIYAYKTCCAKEGKKKKKTRDAVWREFLELEDVSRRKQSESPHPNRILCSLVHKHCTVKFYI